LIIGVAFGAYRRNAATSFGSFLGAKWPFVQGNVTESMITDALRAAKAEHKTLMVEFGANWCSNCQELASLLEKPPARSKLQKFLVFKVDVGQFNRNQEIARKLGIDLNRGIPAAVFYAEEVTRKYGTQPILEYISR